jgi:hypothetical protein
MVGLADSEVGMKITTAHTQRVARSGEMNPARAYTPDTIWIAALVRSGEQGDVMMRRGSSAMRVRHVQAEGIMSGTSGPSVNYFSPIWYVQGGLTVCTSSGC